MKSTFYSAVWTECGILLSDCWHEHGTIGEADSCISRAGGYVVAIENGVMRGLTPAEEAEFQRVHYAPRTDKPEPVSEEKHVDPNILSILLSRLSKWEKNELGRLYAEDKNALLRALGIFLQKGQRGLR